MKSGGDGVFVLDSQSNLIYYNEYIDNNLPRNLTTTQAYDGGAYNDWDNGTIGNYWSDWTTPDNNNDGIVDLPYNISGAFAEWLIEYHGSIRSAVITFQKQVADRLKAGPGNRDYGALSVMVQCFYDISRLFDIPPGCFSPKPKVDSTVLKLEPHRKLDKEIDYGQFKEFLRGCFFQKRKRLTNSLAAAMKISKETIEKSLASLGRKADTRAEQLSLQELMRLYKAVRIYV